jgi:fermentation-respiration switch protein FrsA (DUF1100 family)
MNTSSRRIREFILVIIVLYGLLHLYLFLNQRNFVFYPQDTRSTPAEAGVPQMQVITVKPVDMDASIEGWYQAPSDPSKPVILYFHGNGGGISGRAGVVTQWLKQGYGVLLAEYRGYSGNPGTPGEAELYADGESYLGWLAEHENVPEKRTVLYGESLGSAVAVHLASRHANIAGMILDGSFSSLTDVEQRAMPVVIVPLFFRYPFNSLAFIGDVTCPILFIHGMDDFTVRIDLAQRLYDAANKPKKIELFKDGGHGDLYDHGAGPVVDAFLKSLK